MTLLFVAPRTTLVVNVASGPSAANAAAEVTSLVVEAGVASWSGSCDQSIAPEAGSATAADTCGPRAAADSGPARADRSPFAVGSVPPRVAGASTGPAWLTGFAATVGTLRASSLGGSMRATVMPAASVNTLIMASVSTAARRVRRAMTLLPPRPALEHGVNHPDRPGSNQWTLTFSSRSLALERAKEVRTEAWAA